MAASSAWVPRSASRRIAFMPAGRWVSSSSPRTSTWCVETGRSALAKGGEWDGPHLLAELGDFGQCQSVLEEVEHLDVHERGEVVASHLGVAACPVLFADVEQ